MQKKFLAVTIASIMSLNVFPVNVFRKTVQAEITFKSNVNKIEGPVAGGENDEWKGNYVYFGSYPQTLKEGVEDKSSTDPNDFEIEPIKWRVLDPSNTAWDNSKTIEKNGFKYNTGWDSNNTGEYGGRQNAPVGGSGMLIYSDIALDAKQYHTTYEGNEEVNKLCWGGNEEEGKKGCTLWAWLNGYDNTNVLKKSDTEYSAIPENQFIEKGFSDEELAAIMPTKVYSEDLYNARCIDIHYKYSSSTRTSLTEDKIFLPSYNEILNSSYGFTSTYASSNTRSFGFSNYSNNLKDSAIFWLRSPGYNTYYANAASLNSVGYVGNNGYVVDYTLGLCPALNLNLESVILASKADEVGASDTEGGGKKSMELSSTPKKFELPTGTGNAYKLTLHDENRDNFVAEKTAQNGNEITISYSNAKTGENEYISCMILDDDSEIKYYGKLKEVDSESGEATLTLPEDLEAGKYSVAIINEKCHENNETDWSSWPNGFEVTAEKINEETSSDDKSSDESETKIDFSYNEKYDVNTTNEPNKNENENEIKLPENRVVEISVDETKKIKYEDRTAIVTVKKSGDDFEIVIKDEDGNMLSIHDEIILVIPCENLKTGTVVTQINSDGTQKIIHKSIMRNGKIYLPIKVSGKFEIIDNSKTFYDIPTNHWAYDAVTFVSAHELFNGTAPNIFEPETPMSRAMLTKVLHNLEDNPYQVFEKIFSDVDVEDWFAEAVTWASKNNLVAGYDDGNFGPNDNITREQLATILYRYFGENEIVDTDLNFADTNEISDYALKALHWSVKYKIIQGKGNNILAPKDLAIRAEVAQMFQNLMLNLFY